MTTEERAAKIEAQKALIEKLKFNAECSSISDARYFMNGRKARDDSDIKQAKADLSGLEAGE